MHRPHSNEHWSRLIEGLRNGDETAVRTLAHDLGTFARAFFRWSGQNATEAEALAVSCVTDLVMLLGRGKFDGRNFQGWACRVLRNKLADQSRRQPKFVPLQELDAEYPERASSEEGTLDETTKAALDGALAQLSPEDRQLLALRHGFQPMPYQQVGDELGWSPGNARVRYNRALARLETLLRDDVRMQPWIQRYAVKLSH